MLDRNRFVRRINNLVLNEKFDCVMDVLNKFGYEKLGIELFVSKDKENYSRLKQRIDFFRRNISEIVGYIFGTIACEDDFREFENIDVLVKMTAYISNKMIIILSSFIEDVLHKDYYAEKQRLCRLRKKEREKNATTV